MSNLIRLHHRPEDAAWVQAVMYFPRDKYLRESWFAVETTNSQLHQIADDERFEVDARTLRHLIDAPSFDALKAETAKAIKGGSIAGDVLASIYLMHRFQIPEPSIKKAMHIAARFAKKAKYGDGSTIPRSRRKIQEHWRNYKSVAHLWAAFRLNKAYPYAEPAECFVDKLTDFLGVSSALLNFGKTFVPYRSKPQLPVLDLPNVWEISNDIAPRDLHGGEFPDQLVELLSDYDANEYQYKQ